MPKWEACLLSNGERHVHPMGDKIEHLLQGRSCICQPFLDGQVIVHNSLDGREIAERAKAMLPNQAN